MHLERTDAVDVGELARIPRDEWDWRRHYRIWQANRRVFLYPENYLEPGLRDDKTPLFKDLEDTLLQQQVTEQNVRDGYARYLTGFDELAGLEIAAACWQQGGASPDNPDVLHLFGVTSSEPPVFYYRAIAGLEKAADTKSVRFGPWRKVDLQISAQACSTVIYRGTLYVFWVEITTQPKTSLRQWLVDVHRVQAQARGEVLLAPARRSLERPAAAAVPAGREGVAGHRDRRSARRR